MLTTHAENKHVGNFVAPGWFWLDNYRTHGHFWLVQVLLHQGKRRESTVLLANSVRKVESCEPELYWMCRFYDVDEHDYQHFAFYPGEIILSIGLIQIIRTTVWLADIYYYE